MLDAMIIVWRKAKRKNIVYYMTRSLCLAGTHKVLSFMLVVFLAAKETHTWRLHGTDFAVMNLLFSL